MAILINNKYPEQPSLCFENMQYEIIAYTFQDLQRAFNAISQAQHQGLYLAGYLSYELGFFLEPAFTNFIENIALNTPLLHFKAYKKMTAFNGPHKFKRATAGSPYNLTSFFSNMKLAISFEEYQDKIQQLKKYIYDGETYQTNLTSHYQGSWQGNPQELFQQLLEQQRVEYAAFLPDFSGTNILSISPELFFKKQDNLITCKPMKGTAKRLPIMEEDLRQQFYLKTDQKIRAENTMIVDLLRNDLGKISDPASVEVKQLLACEHYETLHQMTSTIQATLPSHITFEAIIKGLFPCGSITGAPKIRTMQIIHELEKRQRGIYTGAIGYITPKNDMCFNVAIRTAELHQDKIVLGVGGGILHDSNAQDEFAEMQLKAKFLLDIST